MPPFKFIFFSYLSNSLYRAIVFLIQEAGGSLWLVILQHCLAFTTITFLAESNSDLCCRDIGVV